MFGHVASRILRIISLNRKLLIFSLSILCLLHAFINLLLKYPSNSSIGSNSFAPLGKHSSGEIFRPETSVSRYLVTKIEQYSNGGDQTKSSGHTGCRSPDMDPFAPELKPFIKQINPVQCSDEQDWIVVSKGVAKLGVQLNKSSSIHCTLTYLIRVDEFTARKGNLVTISSSNPEVILEHDHFWVKCTNGTRDWSNIIAGIHRDDKIIERAKAQLNELKDDTMKKKLNILMFGYDSVSRMNFIRQMPKSYKHLVEHLNATVLETYNIVGDGTPQALIPILTSFAEPELPETRQRMPNSVPCDVYPMIWKNYSDKGYVTAWMEDGGIFGTFTYRLKGFEKQPVDHYGRPFDLEASKLYSKNRDYCLGSQTRHMVMMNWVRQFYDVYQDVPKFAFCFHSEYSHGSFNLIQVADGELQKWLLQLENDGILDNTILILMSDHGNRFASIRETRQGKLEERLPFFSFILPKWFQDKFPNAYRNLQLNAKERLMTPFDIHATFLTVLNHFNHGNDVTNDRVYKESDKLPRSLSLFEKIPKFRDCHHASIEAHWCTCLSWRSAGTDDPIVVSAAKFLVEFLNGLTDEVRNLCVTLKLDRITKADIAEPNKSFLMFKQSKDIDGLKADLSGSTSVTDVIYQIQLITTPNQGLYEATLNYNTVLKSFKATESQISRANMYGKEPHCIFKTHQGLRKYCYCKLQM